MQNPYSQTLERYSASQSFDSAAIAFFLDNYTLVGPPTTWSDQTHKPSSFVQDTMAAVGLAALAQIRRDKGMMMLGRSRYGSALQVVNSAIQHPIEALKEQTLAAAFVMLMFEVERFPYSSI